MTDPNTIAQSYLSLWNEEDDTVRRERLARGWSADANYVDPMMAGQSREGIARIIEAARAQFPGHRFTLAGTPDSHGSFVRFSWTLGLPSGAPVARGTDVVRLDGNGQIAEVIGFLDGAAA
ncbi:MAG: nuclear transport factor 2 family protein [Nitrospiraceae bacterium]|nr:nuclear transport factor 2 family protein [Nitrospiraceae bacterium]